MFSTDEERALRVARRIETEDDRHQRVPAGSRLLVRRLLGRPASVAENGPEVLASYLEVKSVFG